MNTGLTPITTMSPEAIQRGANAIRYYDAVVMPHHMALHRACLARGLDSEAAIRQSAIELVAELGDPLVQCIRDLWDARVRTPAGAVTALCRDWVTVPQTGGQ